MWRHDGDNWSSSVNNNNNIFFDGGGYLSGEDARGERGGADAAADRDGGGVLTEDGVGVQGDGGGIRFVGPERGLVRI